jgi:glucose/mannose transport system substrate-binding protein
MRSSRNLFGGLCVVAALAVSAPACSDGGDTGSIEILDWWKQGGEAQAIGALLDLFKQRNPRVKIVDSSVDGSALARANIRSKISDGIPPDTFQANGGWDLMAWVLYNGRDADQSQLQELDQALLDGFDPSVKESVSYKDTIYGVPLNIHRVNTFFYNQAVFDRVGLNIGDLKRLPDLFAAAETIKAWNEAHPKDPPITPFAMGYRQTEGDNAVDDTWTLALLFFENILVANLGGDDYKQLFTDPKPGAMDTEVTMANALAAFRQLVLYSNLNASALTWNEPLDMVLRGDAAMTIMGDWGKGYATSLGYTDATFGVIPTPGTSGTFVFTTDTFGLTVGARNPHDTLELLKLFGSREGQDIFNPIKGSISARSDSDIENGHYDDMAKQTFADFNSSSKVPATSILAPQIYLDAIGIALAEFAKARENGNPSLVQHTLDNYADVLLASCWPTPALNCH